MRAFQPLFLIALCLPLLATAQTKPEEVTDTQVAVFKRGMDLGCRDSGKQQGLSESVVNTFCDCTSKALSDSVSADNWRQAYFADMKGQDSEVERLVFAPNAAKLRACQPKR